MKFRLFLTFVIFLLFLQACGQVPRASPAGTVPPFPSQVVLTPNLERSTAQVPNFKHIVIIMFENKEFDSVIGPSSMPHYNELARQYTLLTQYYAVGRPSLPNYLALIGGDTFGIDRDCRDCFIDQSSLPDLIEASGRTWKTYQEDMPSRCFLGNKGKYAQKHNPFIYFDAIRLDTARCERSVVPLTELQTDIQTNSLPNFMFITPNLCNDAHDCKVTVADAWLTDLLDQLVPALDATGDPYAIFMLFDEGKTSNACCGLLAKAGGHVPAVIYSPQVKNGFEDSTPYTHYSLLKTIANAWGLPYLGHAAEDSNQLIVAPWK